jgi:hypothetical protein
VTLHAHFFHALTIPSETEEGGLCAQGAPPLSRPPDEKNAGKRHEKRVKREGSIVKMVSRDVVHFSTNCS